jgi:uncharacterized membrane protein
MDFKKIFYVFFTLMSLTTTIGFVFIPSHLAIFIATGINVMSSILHIGTRNLIAAESLASSLVADLHLIPAFIFYVIYDDLQIGLSFAIGAIVANIFSLLLTLSVSAKQDNDDRY